MTKRIISHRHVISPKLKQVRTLAVVTDLHNGAYADVLDVLRTADAVLIVGDLLNRHRHGFANAAQFLLDAPACAPTYYAIGNHEWKSPDRPEFWPLVEKSAVTVLDNDLLRMDDIVLGALSSQPKEAIDAGIVERMAQEDGFRLLLCHHPEWYPRFVQGHGIDLTLAGHAHGGQIQLFGQGLYAPGQGILPRYTHGYYDNGRMLVSRGMTNSCGMPRWGNPCELILLHLQPGKEVSYE